MTKFLTVLTILLIVLSGYMFYQLKERDWAGNGSTVSDTIYLPRIDTFIKEKLVPKNVYVDKIITDTLFSIDSIPVVVNIPISTNKFRDTIVNNSSDSVIINSSISGYKVFFDSLNVVLKVKERVVTNTIKPKQYRIVIGPSLGIGYVGKGIQPFIGVTVTIPLFKF